METRRKSVSTKIFGRFHPSIVEWKMIIAEVNEAYLDERPSIGPVRRESPWIS
jgi:hypothetical protein